ncbi:hypothetical protein FE257_001777 [Aspergillus nanangensis]|uniref:chitinase n=1 Tax=Aspergillus nanangensis TaxID=2582783 RepID=A0AAD4CDF8_ASPNN|nr:hypothetical protein FE257_001777 [Aspergillus nanangensis]
MGGFEKPLLFMLIIALVGMSLFLRPNNEGVADVGPRRQRCDEYHRCESGCCSTAGFCGRGPEYCSSADRCIDCNRRERPRCKSIPRRFVGYFELWNGARPCNRFSPANIPSATYEHVNVAFLTINPETFELNPLYKQHAYAIAGLVSRKKYDPDLRVWVTISGLAAHDWAIKNVSVFSELARSEAHQKVFIKSLVSFMSTYDIDGVDVNWEHPDGSSDDYANLPRLVQNIKAALSLTNGRWGLSMTLPVSLHALHGYNVRKLAGKVDYFNLMPIDLHSQLQRGDTWNGEYLGPAVNMTQVNEAIDFLWMNHIHPDIINMGLALFGTSLVPEHPECVSPGCPAVSGAAPGHSSRKMGMLMNSEIQDLRNPEKHELSYGTLRHQHDWPAISTSSDPDAGVRIAMGEKLWIAYDDRETLKSKVDFARDACVGGVAAWAITHDTYWGDYAKILDCLLEGRRKSLQLFYCDDILI